MKFDVEIRNSGMSSWAYRFCSFHLIHKLFHLLHILFILILIGSKIGNLLGETLLKTKKQTLPSSTDSSYRKQYKPRRHFGSPRKSKLICLSSAVVHLVDFYIVHGGNMSMILLMKTWGTTWPWYLSSSSCWCWSMAAFPETAHSQAKLFFYFILWLL